MLLSLTLVSLFLTPVLSLDCYVCSSSTTNEQCNTNTEECQTPLDTCMTSIDILGLSKAIVKQCASKATCQGASSSASVDENGNGNIVNCCNSHNLCNFSGAESVRFTVSLLLLTLAVVLTVTVTGSSV